jgi:hypothetical protein
VFYVEVFQVLTPYSVVVVFQREDGGKIDLRNVGILPQHNTTQHNATRRHNSEDGGSTDLWNVDILPQHYTASQPRRPRLEKSPPWKPQNWIQCWFLEVQQISCVD